MRLRCDVQGENRILAAPGHTVKDDHPRTGGVVARAEWVWDPRSPRPAPEETIEGTS